MHFFVHIPKTAGTSFRLAVERHFSPEQVVYDYGPQSPVTSPGIQQHLYGEGDQDKAAFYEHCREHGIKLIAGHRPATRYLDGVAVPNIITFVREPLARVFSQYLHFKRHQGFEGSFRDFFSVPTRQNAQAHMLRGISPRALGFVGITEQYRQSLRMINRHYGWRLRHKRANRSGFFEPGPDSVSQADRALFHELNSDDFLLYREACWLFDIRRRLAAQGHPFAHAAMELVDGKQVRGWAWWAEPAEEPPRIEICVNETLVKTVAADRELKGWVKAGAPSQGRVGFVAGIDARPGDRITCRIAQTSQPLIPEPAIAA